jgi:hypothetical protein
MRIYLLPVILVVCGTALTALAEMSVSAERQEIVAQIDFGALQSQASAALERLRQLREHRLAQAGAVVF